MLAALVGAIAYVLALSIHVGGAAREAGPLPASAPRLHAKVDEALEPFITRREGALRVELQLAPDAMSSLDLEQLGVTVARYGVTVVDAWIDAERLVAIAETTSEIAFIRLPHRPSQSFGQSTSEGVAAIKADALQCAGVNGSGIAIADVDTSFDQFAQAQAAGELGSVASTPAAGGNAHGTGTAEIIFDVAPGVVLYPLEVATLADLESAITNLPASVSIVSHSLTWTGLSFGDGTGPLCDLVDSAAARGVVFVTSAGNEAAGNFYMGEFTDSDADNIHEFAAGDEINQLTLQGSASARVFLDWDAYPTTDVDYDLHLQQRNGGTWTTIASSTRGQDGTVDPTEEIDSDLSEGETYGIVVSRKSSDTPSRRLRVFVFPDDTVTMQYATAAGSLVDPASCNGAITVGGVLVQGYSADATYADSSQGPTSDGRIKPDIVGPTNVTTSFGPFIGTSSAAPHVAAAVALYMQAGQMTAAQAATAVVADATPAGSPDPNNTYGHGLLLLDPTRGGAVCTPNTSEACTTSCGSSGVHTCNDHCGYATCIPPIEICNGLDDDCDGVPDNGFACPAGLSAPCTTSCGSTGAAPCDAACTLGACQPPSEICNGIDDDCDGVIDGPSVCLTHGVSQSCQDSPTAALACYGVLASLALRCFRRRWS